MEERMLEAEFSAAWKGLSDDQRRALVRDVMCIEEEDGLSERAAIRLLLRRIGGPSALAGYADVLLAGDARRRAQLAREGGAS